MNFITLVLVTVCFILGASFIWIEAVNFGVVFFTVAMLVAASGPAGAKAASAPALHGLADASVAGAGAQCISDDFDSNIFRFAVAASPETEDDPKPVADLVRLRKEFGEDFAVVTAGPAVQAQIDGLFAAADALAPFRASRDAGILARIVPPHSLTSAA